MKKNILRLLNATAFAPGEPGWKLDADGKIELKDGNPVYIDASGREMTVQHDTIARLNSEAKSHREAKEAAEAKLQAYKDLDPEAARKAIETVSKLDAKKLIDAGEIDKVKDAIKSEFTAQLTEKDKALIDLQARYDTAQISHVFAGSEFLRERIAVPRDMVEATFRSNFKVEDGKIVAYDRTGNRLMSKKTVGEYADANEALELLIEMHPQKDVILKPNGGNGSGNGGGGGARGGGGSIRRADFEKLTPVQQAETAAKVRSGEIQMTD